MSIVGFHCVKDTAYLSVVEDGVVVDSVQRVKRPANLEGAEATRAIVGDLSRTISDIGPDEVVVLARESQYEATHAAFWPVVEFEVAVFLAADERGVQSSMSYRPGVRSALKLPKKGGLDTHVKLVFPEPHGRYWTAGRGVAALAARARESTGA